MKLVVRDTAEWLLIRIDILQIVASFVLQSK